MTNRLNRTLDHLAAPQDLMFLAAIGPCLLVWCGLMFVLDLLGLIQQRRFFPKVEP